MYGIRKDLFFPNSRDDEERESIRVDLRNEMEDNDGDEQRSTETPPIEQKPSQESETERTRNVILHALFVNSDDEDDESDEAIRSFKACQKAMRLILDASLEAKNKEDEIEILPSDDPPY